MDPANLDVILNKYRNDQLISQSLYLISSHRFQAIIEGRYPSKNNIYIRRIVLVIIPSSTTRIKSINCIFIIHNLNNMNLKFKWRGSSKEMLWDDKNDESQKKNEGELEQIKNK